MTGIDADRLEEEKRRGITIDLGFAHLDLMGADGEPLHLGFVDVPGHERFVRNMLAGVGGIDLVLLVIAADESIKPQTREHFDILQLLGVQRGITVLTKSDAVDAETLDVVRLEVEEFLQGTFLQPPKAPIVAVSSLTGAGLDDLKRAMVAAAAKCSPAIQKPWRACRWIASFTMKGFGTVVTGTLMSGTIHRDQELEVFPTGRRVRVRGVQVHGQAGDAAVAGQRTALNLGGREHRRSITRHDPRARVDVYGGSARGCATQPVKLCAATVEIPAACTSMPTRWRRWRRLCFIGVKQLTPGSHAFARIKLPGAALLLPGDRFIIRQFSPVVTIGGGTVLDPAPVPRMPGHEAFLQLLAAGDTSSILRTRIARRGHNGMTMSQLVAETGWTGNFIESQIAKAVKEKMVLRIGDLFVDAPAIAALQQNDRQLSRRISPEELAGGRNCQGSTARASESVDRGLHGVPRFPGERKEDRNRG